MIARSADHVRGRADYHELGPLAPADLERLDAMVSDTVRRRTLSNVYGRKGGAYAWALYQLRRGAPQTSRKHLPRHQWGRDIDTIRPGSVL